MTAIRALTPGDVDALVALSLRAWTPVFASLREQLGDPIFLRLHPDWRADQEAAVRDTCGRDDVDTFVAERDSTAVGFVATVLNAFHSGMGAVEMIAVDPDHQRLGIGRELMCFAHRHLRDAGMDVVVVETGGDPGHAPARRTYEASGYTLLPIARYFRLLDDAGSDAGSDSGSDSGSGSGR